MWPESIQRMGPEWFNFVMRSKLGRPNSPRYGDVLRLSPRLHGRSTAPGSTVVGRTDAATSGKSGAYAAYLRIFYQLGFPIAESKFEGSTTCMTFLGFVLDTEVAEMRLPESKLMKLKELLQQWQGKRSCTPKELESLIEKLGHAAQVVILGKTFLRRMFELRSKMGWMGR